MNSKNDAPNAYDEKYVIRLANADDIPSIMSFIGDNWRKDHILSRNRELFEYEFLEGDGNVNFVVAANRKTKQIESISGYLKASHDTEHLDIWGVMWMSHPQSMPLLGLELLKRRQKLTGARAEIGVGDNPNTSIPLMKRCMNRYTGKMNHYYMLAPLDDYKIAKINSKPSLSLRHGIGKIIHFRSIEELTGAFNLEQYKSNIPYKDSWYLDHRFFGHISYEYDVCGIVINDTVRAIMVLRNECVEDRCAIRIVDYIGEQEAILEIGDYFGRLLSGPGVEYIDFYNLGFNEEYLYLCGFSLNDADDTNIIPNYFHPFVRSNVDIWVSSNMENSVFYKGDSDQDRPN